MREIPVTANDEQEEEIMYTPKEDRYESMIYARCGRSGLKLPRVSLGLWQNFGLEKSLEDQRKII